MSTYIKQVAEAAWAHESDCGRIVEQIEKEREL